MTPTFAFCFSTNNEQRDMRIFNARYLRIYSGMLQSNRGTYRRVAHLSTGFARLHLSPRAVPIARIGEDILPSILLGNHRVYPRKT